MEDTYGLLEWVGKVADTALLKTFFRLENPAVAAIWWNLTHTYGLEADQSSTLLEAGLAVRDGDWFRYDFDADLLKLALSTGRKDLTDRILDVWAATTLLRGYHARKIQISFSTLLCGFHARQLQIPSTAEPARDDGHAWIWPMEIWTKVQRRLGTHCIDFEGSTRMFVYAQTDQQVNCVRWLLDASASGDPLFDWVPISTRSASSILDRSPESLPRFTGKRMAFLFGSSPQLAKWKQPGGWLDIITTIWALYSAANSGREALELQMRLLGDYPSPHSDFLLQMTLSEAVDMANVEVAATLLDFGVDPNTGLLPQYQSWDIEICLDALLRASGYHRVDLITLLVHHGADMETKRPLALKLASSISNRSSHVRAAGLWATLMVLLEPQRYERHEDQGSPPQPEALMAILVMKGLSWLEDARDLTSLQHCQLLTRLFPTNTLREAIKAGCSLIAVESLLAQGFTVEPGQLAQGHTVLHDALSARSDDRVRIVEMLLHYGADPAVDTDEPTILEATLESTASPDVPCSIYQWQSKQKQSLQLFDQLRDLGARVPACSIRLLGLLVAHKASLSTIQQVQRGTAHPLHLGVEFHRILPYALVLGQTRTAEWLLEQGADPTVGTYEKRTALWAACFQQAPALLIQLLIKREPKLVRHLEFPGRTPLQIAASNGHIETAGLLLSHNVRINDPGTNLSGEPLAMTALDWAALEGRLDMVKFLVDCGGQSACQGLTEFDGAFWHGRAHLGVLKFLEQHTQCGLPSVMASLKELFPKMLSSDADIDIMRIITVEDEISHGCWEQAIRTHRTHQPGQ